MCGLSSPAHPFRRRYLHTNYTRCTQITTNYKHSSKFLVKICRLFFFRGSPYFKECILIVFANIISCSFSHLYVIISAGPLQFNVILWLFPLLPCVLYPPRTECSGGISGEQKSEMIRFHLESQMSSSCLCPFCFQRASGWCGELAERVRTWEGDIYHPLDYRAVTLPAWKSCGESKEREKGKKKKTMVIALQGWHRYRPTALVLWFWVVNSQMHHLQMNLIRTCHLCICASLSRCNFPCCLTLAVRSH